MKKFGVITEQGDLGLGFDVLNEQDQKIVNEAVEHKDKKDDNKQVRSFHS